LEEEYYQKYSDQQGIAFKLHKFWAKYINKLLVLLICYF
jgi:hypothetical protein